MTLNNKTFLFHQAVYEYLVDQHKFLLGLIYLTII